MTPMWWNGPFQGMGPGMGWGMLAHGVFWLFLLALAIIGAIAIARSVFGARNTGKRGGNRSPGLDILEERYARGEIQREEYLRMRSDLGG